MKYHPYVVEHRERICLWLTANGIDPKDVPFDARVRVEADEIVCPVYLRNEKGRLYVDPENPDQAARETIRRPLIAEPGETVARWLLMP